MTWGGVRIPISLHRPTAAWWWNQLLSFQSVVSSHRERNRCRPDQAVIMLKIPGSPLSPSSWSGKVTQRDDPQRQQVGAMSYSSTQNTSHDNWSVTCICLPMICSLQPSAQQQSSHFLEGGCAIKDNQGILPVPNSFILIYFDIFKTLLKYHFTKERGTLSYLISGGFVLPISSPLQACDLSLHFRHFYLQILVRSWPKGDQENICKSLGARWC
jgi:hypothetical protein